MLVSIAVQCFAIDKSTHDERCIHMGICNNIFAINYCSHIAHCAILMTNKR